MTDKIWIGTENRDLFAQWLQSMIDLFRDHTEWQADTYKRYKESFANLASSNGYMSVKCEMQYTLFVMDLVKYINDHNALN